MQMTSEKTMNRLRQHQWLQRMSWLEGSTLLLLVFIAVPLKRLADMPEMVSILGPIHGGAFVLYALMVVIITARAPWTKQETGVLLLAALIPLGAWMVRGMLQRKQRELLSFQVLQQRPPSRL